MSLNQKPNFFEYFDESQFMFLPDGRVAYATDRSTWANVFLHGIPINEHLETQHTVNIPKWIKPKKSQKTNEELNNGNKCDDCHNKTEDVIFVTTYDGKRKIVCDQCVPSIQQSMSGKDCVCCYLSRNCIAVRTDWSDKATFVPMCQDCYIVECCGSCHVWSGCSSLCKGCRHDYSM